MHESPNRDHECARLYRDIKTRERNQAITDTRGSDIAMMPEPPDRRLMR
jgi:hypothetical protein